MSAIYSKNFMDDLVKALDIKITHINRITIDSPINDVVTLKVCSYITVDQADKLNELLKEYELKEK